MRWSAIILLAIGGFGACLGAALTYRQRRQTNQPTTPEPAISVPVVIDKRDVLPLAAIKAPPTTGELAMRYARTLVGYGPRYSRPNGRPTPGWTRQLTFIAETLKQAGLKVERDTWTDRKELITFTNLSARIPGRGRERIVLACHHDTKCTTGHPTPEHNFEFVGANDGASGVALLLALAPVLRQRDNAASIELVFFDGEESLDWHWNDAARALFGSRRYVKRHRDARLLGNEPRIVAMVLLDMVGRKDLHIQEELYSTELLRRICWSAAVANGYRQQFYRRAERAADDHTPFLEVGIPAVDLIDLNGNPTWHTPYDTLDNMSATSLQQVADVVLTMLPAVEQAYVTEPR